MSETVNTNQPRCQSCGMPLGEGFWGSEASGALSSSYCRFCYQEGQFTQPDLTLEGAIQRTVTHMTTELHFEPEKAEQIARGFLPTLERWKHQENSQ
ncbi:MAG TPA: zinc ribbon domain-containing protein [Vitreimonas sp.]|nr:zinc ribbon domain-containing protein [Vitreimonas sp.]